MGQPALKVVTPARVEPEKDRGGTWIAIGVQEYKVPPLAFGAIRELQERIAGMADLQRGGVPTAEQMATVIDVVAAAIRRNYPALTAADLNEMIDLGNYEAVLAAVLGGSGFTRGAGTAGER